MTHHYKRTTPVEQTMKTFASGEVTMKIRKWGYEYTLVEGSLARQSADIPSPNFMGHPNWALRSCRKLDLKIK